MVVKVYAPDVPGWAGAWAEERAVYERLGAHPAFSVCLTAGPGWLALRRLDGLTLYDAVIAGRPIPAQVMRDIDAALAHARDRGLNPQDVHGRNVMVGSDGTGLVVDVSDFLRAGSCRKWRDVRLGYHLLYRPLLAPLARLGVGVSPSLLDVARHTYRSLGRTVRAAP